MKSAEGVLWSALVGAGLLVVASAGWADNARFLTVKQAASLHQDAKVEVEESRTQTKARAGTKTDAELRAKATVNPGHDQDPNRYDANGKVRVTSRTAYVTKLEAEKPQAHTDSWWKRLCWWRREIRQDKPELNKDHSGRPSLAEITDPHEGFYDQFAADPLGGPMGSFEAFDVGGIGGPLGGGGPGNVLGGGVGGGAGGGGTGEGPVGDVGGAVGDVGGAVGDVGGAVGQLLN